MRIIKRSGREVDFDAKKIYRAISAANNSVAADLRLTETELKAITQKVETACFEARTIGTSSLAEGTYVARIATNSQSVSKKIVVGK